MKSVVLLGVLLVSMFLGACSDASKNDDSEASSKQTMVHVPHGSHGPNGGHYVELGQTAHLEFVHDAEGGMAKAYITGPDAKTPLTLMDEPVLKLMTDQGAVQVTMNKMRAEGGKASEFACRNAALKVEKLQGRLTVKINGKHHNPDLAETYHDH